MLAHFGAQLCLNVAGRNHAHSSEEQLRKAHQLRSSGRSLHANGMPVYYSLELCGSRNFIAVPVSVFEAERTSVRRRFRLF